MLHINNSIIKHKAGLLNLASELQNVSKACKIMGVSRDTFYRYQELVETDGLEGLINRSRRTPNLKNRVDDVTENAVVDYAIDFPAHGQHRTSNELRKRGVFVSDQRHMRALHKTILQEFYQVTFRKKLYAHINTLQKDLTNGSIIIIVIELIRARCAMEERQWKPCAAGSRFGMGKT